MKKGKKKSTKGGKSKKGKTKKKEITLGISSK